LRLLTSDHRQEEPMDAMRMLFACVRMNKYWSGILCRSRRSVGAQRRCARTFIRFRPPYRETIMRIGS